MTDYVITEGAVVTPSEVFDPGYVAVADGRITAVGRARPPTALVQQASVIEGGGRWVVPGFIDVHVHGGDGAQVNGDSVGEVAASMATIARFHARHGTTSLLATAVSDTPGACGQPWRASPSSCGSAAVARGCSAPISRGRGSPGQSWAPRTRRRCATPRSTSSGSCSRRAGARFGS